MLSLQTVDQVNFGAHRKYVTGFSAFDRFANIFGGTYPVGGFNYRRRTFGMHDHLRVGVVGSCLVDLGNREALMDGAKPVPQNDFGVLELLWGQATQRQIRSPQWHLLFADAHGLGGIAA